MNLTKILFMRSLDKFENNIHALEVALCDLKFEIYKMKDPLYAEYNATMEMLESENACD